MFARKAGPSCATLFTSAPAPASSLMAARELGRDVLHADAEPRARDLARLEDLLATRCAMLLGTAKPMPCPLPDDHRVDAEHVALQIAERSARVAGVDARVGLQVVLDGVHPDPAASLGGEDAGGHRVPEAERRADGDDPLAHARGVGVGEPRGGKARSVDLDDGQIRRGIAADQARRPRRVGLEPPQARFPVSGWRPGPLFGPNWTFDRPFGYTTA